MNEMTLSSETAVMGSEEDGGPFLQHEPPSGGQVEANLHRFIAGCMVLHLTVLGPVWMLLDKRDGKPLYGHA